MPVYQNIEKRLSTGKYRFQLPESMGEVTGNAFGYLLETEIYRTIGGIRN